MRQVNIAMALIKQGDKYLLQHRNGDPKIGAAGFSGCFGGKIDEGETPLNAVFREIPEETTIKPKLEDFKKIGMVHVKSDHQLEPVKITAHVFAIEISPDKSVKALEGKLIKITKKEAFANLDKLTPATRATFKELI